MDKPIRQIVRETKKLSPKLRTLLIQAVQQCGSYDPDEVLLGVEEHMNSAEYHAASMFLTWICDDESNRKFGTGNIDQRFQEWSAN